MTAEQAADILNQNGYLAKRRGKAKWYTREFFRIKGDGPVVMDGLGHVIDEFAAVAIAEKYEREAAKK